MNTTRYRAEWEAFKADTRRHAITVVKDDGLYRHIIMSTPGTFAWRWEVTTWPGSLAIRGDIGMPLVFTREPDMFEFFATGTYDDGAPRISPLYWAEKTGMSHVLEEEYSETEFRRQVARMLGDAVDDATGYGTEGDGWERDLAAACAVLHLWEDMDFTDPAFEHTAREWAMGHTDLLGDDFYQKREFNGLKTHFIFTCFALAMTVAAYRDHKAKEVDQ